MRLCSCAFVYVAIWLSKGRLRKTRPRAMYMLDYVYCTASTTHVAFLMVLFPLSLLSVDLKSSLNNLRPKTLNAMSQGAAAAAQAHTKLGHVLGTAQGLGFRVHRGLGCRDVYKCRYMVPSYSPLPSSKGF